MPLLRASVTCLHSFYFNFPFLNTISARKSLSDWYRTLHALIVVLLPYHPHRLTDPQLRRCNANSQGHPASLLHCASDNCFGKLKTQHRGRPHRWPPVPPGKGVPRSAALGDCRFGRIMVKLSFCNAQMRLSLVLQLLTGSRRDAVSNRGSICRGMRLDLALPVYSVHLTMN